LMELVELDEEWKLRQPEEMAGLLEMLLKNRRRMMTGADL
jgi:hypothetical protein